MTVERQGLVERSRFRHLGMEPMFHGETGRIHIDSRHFTLRTSTVWREGRRGSRRTCLSHLNILLSWRHHLQVTWIQSWPESTIFIVVLLLLTTRIEQVIDGGSSKHYDITINFYIYRYLSGLEWYGGEASLPIPLSGLFLLKSLEL